jgi:pyruvate formate lyase activating enzyme
MKNLPPTPISTMEKLKNTAQQQGLHYVYVGNIPGHEGENTVCPNCGKTIVKRLGYIIEKIHISNARCEFCGHKIPGFWS